MRKPDPVSVNKAAVKVIERYQDRAIEMAEEVLAISANPVFSAAVIAEIRRLLEETRH